MWQDSSNEAIGFSEFSRLILPNSLNRMMSEILKTEEDNLNIKIVQLC